MADQFLAYLKKKYPRGNAKLEQELQLTDEFSDADEELMCLAVDKIESELDKPLQKQFKCLMCEKSFKTKQLQQRHLKTHCVTFDCNYCKKKFSRKLYLDKHRKKCATKVTNVTISNPGLFCKHCDLHVLNYTELYNHVVSHHPLQFGGNIQQSGNHNLLSKEEPNNDQKKTIKASKKVNHNTSSKSALGGTVKTTNLFPNNVDLYDILQFYADSKHEVLNELKQTRENVRQIKWYLSSRVEMIRDLDDGTQRTVTAHFRSKTYESFIADDNDHNVNEAFQKMNGAMEEFIHKGSNWINCNSTYEVDLLYLSGENKSHYCCIKNLNRFLKMTRPNDNNKRYYCRRCLHGFTRQKGQEYIQRILSNPEPLIMNHETEKLFQNAKHCHICEKLFTNEDIKIKIRLT
ncbi:hypothetical protein KUTeg_011252 [Tegillarca granosa]|uniref:C2H2-type domain-containing protein n=1 Tax=Tegillarca granosa TaxID=220873 RepID=A0ABQ9F1H1_TEGGR|nr:hypothetical protein KUTeg_011252 [Tegillarca granosa]